MSSVAAVGVVQARSVVARFRPDVVLATGGYVAVPVRLAAWMCRRPLVVHEQTVRLGLANRILARVTTRMAVSSSSTLALLPGSARRAAVVTGNPVRPEIFLGHADKAVEALELHGFDRGLPTAYVTRWCARCGADPRHGNLGNDSSGPRAKVSIPRWWSRVPDIQRHLPKYTRQGADVVAIEDEFLYAERGRCSSLSLLRRNWVSRYRGRAPYGSGRGFLLASGQKQ